MGCHPSELEGLIPDEQVAQLITLASFCPRDEAIVEIGSYKGKSTCALARGAELIRGAHVWAVDPWNLEGNVNGRFGFARNSTRLAFEQQVRRCGLEGRITPIQAFSVDAAVAWDGPPVGLLYVDGDHSARAVTDDFHAWYPHLSARATVAFDDLDTPRNPGVRRALEGMGLDFEVRGRLAVVHSPEVHK